MCQLLGMNCASPTDFTYSLKGFFRRGGETDKHAHGWGAAIYEGRGIRCFKDTQAACRSPMAQFLLLMSSQIRTHNMMAHIRYATVGKVSLENVHPFTRELWGIPFTFCHNGECPPFAGCSNNSHDNTTSVDNNNNNYYYYYHNNKPLPLLGRTTRNDIMYQPIGDTDSEAVFCCLLNAIRVEFPMGPPPMPVLFCFLSQLCLEISQLSNATIDATDTTETATATATATTTPATAYTGNDNDNDNDNNKIPTICNFLLGCGPYSLFAYSWPGSRPGSKVWNGLHYIIREPPFSTAQLIDADCGSGFIDFSTVTTPNDRVAVITTKPLTYEAGWAEVPKGKLVLFEKGCAYWSATDYLQQQQQQQQALLLAEQHPHLYPKTAAIAGIETRTNQNQDHKENDDNDPRPAAAVMAVGHCPSKAVSDGEEEDDDDDDDVDDEVLEGSHIGACSHGTMMEVDIVI